MRFRLQAKGKTYRLVEGHGRRVPGTDRFLSSLELRGLSVRTVRAYGFDLVIVFRWLTASGNVLEKLTAKELFDFIAWQKKRNAKPRSINHRITALRLLYRFAYEKEVPGMFSMNPWRRWTRDPVLGTQIIQRAGGVQPRVKVPRTVVEPLSPPEVSRFFETLKSYRDVAIALLMLFCGLRSLEILLLDLDGLDLERGEIRVSGKGDKERVVPLPQAAIDAIRRYLTRERPLLCETTRVFVVMKGERCSSPMTPAGLRSLFRSKRRKSGVMRANAHRFRHTFGTDMARSGMKLSVLQRLMGHSTPMMTMKYINLSLEDVNREYQKAIRRIHKRYEGATDPSAC